MKIFLFVSFLLVGLVYSTPVETFESSEVSIEELKVKAIYDYVNNKCASENDSTKNATVIFKEIVECLQPYGPDKPEEFSNLGKPGYTYHVCESPEKIEKIPECFLPVMDLLKNCGDDEEKYLPEFIIDAIRNLINFACANDGKNIQSFFTIFFIKTDDFEQDNSTVNCYETMKENLKTTVHPCTAEGKNFIAMMDDGVITKKEFCDAMEADKVCNINMIEKMCPDDSTTKEVYRGFLDAITGSCTDKKRTFAQNQQF